MTLPFYTSIIHVDARSILSFRIRVHRPVAESALVRSIDEASEVDISWRQSHLFSTLLARFSTRRPEQYITKACPMS